MQIVKRLGQNKSEEETGNLYGEKLQDIPLSFAFVRKTRRSQKQVENFAKEKVVEGKNLVF